MSIAASAAHASTLGLNQCGTEKAGGHKWTISTLSIPCATAKAALPKLITEKPFGQVRRSALIKQPKGFPKPCGVSFDPKTTTSKAITVIECTKKAAL